MKMVIVKENGNGLAGYGKLSFWKEFFKAPAHLFWGLKYKYPACCIKFYILCGLAGIPAAETSSRLFGRNSRGRATCPKCSTEIINF